MKVTVKFDLDLPFEDFAHDILVNRIDIMGVLSAAYEFAPGNFVEEELGRRGLLGLFHYYRWVYEGIKLPDEKDDDCAEDPEKQSECVSPVAHDRKNKLFNLLSKPNPFHPKKEDPK